MKKLIMILPFLALFIAALSQNKLPAFGKVDRSDLEMKDCEFDPGASAFVLIDFGEIEFKFVENIGWVSESIYRVRIKVLKEKGVSTAQIKLRYRTEGKLEEIINVRGISVNLDAGGNIEESELEKRLIYEKAIDREMTEISFALPNVKVGTVFEYRYKLLRKSYSYIPSWYFQRDIPVRYSAYNLIVPEYFLFTVQSTARQELKRESILSNGFGKGDWYIMHNIPGLKDEQFSPGRRDYLQRVEFQLSAINAPGFYQDIRTTWPKISEELLAAEVFGGEIKKTVKGTKDLDAQLNYNQTTKEKIRIIYNYVQANMQWNEQNGIAAYGGIKPAWDKKTGTMADINFILISLLNDAQIKAKPLLISTKENGRVNPYYPFLNQFNGVMAYVKDGEDVYIMNAADKLNPFSLVPYNVAYTYGLIVDKNESNLIEIYPEGKFSHTVFFNCSVEASGKLSGQATLKSLGYARNIRLAAIRKKRLNEIIEDNAGINIKVDSAYINNEADEMLPLEQKADFSGEMQTGGEYFFLPYNLFTGMGKNLFVEENRVMDIDFNFPKSYVVSGTFFLPEEFSVNVLPKNTKLIMPDTSIVLSRSFQKDGDIVSFRFSLDIKVPGYRADAYPYIKEFFKKMYEILDERIVLIKK